MGGVFGHEMSAHWPGRPALRVRLRELGGKRRRIGCRHFGSPQERAEITLSHKNFLANLRGGWLEGQRYGISRSGNSDRLSAICHDNFPNGKVDPTNPRLATAVWEPAYELGSRSSDEQGLGLAGCRRRLVTVLFWLFVGEGLSIEIGFKGRKDVDRCWKREKIFAPISSIISTGWSNDGPWDGPDRQ